MTFRSFRYRWFGIVVGVGIVTIALYGLARLGFHAFYWAGKGLGVPW